MRHRGRGGSATCWLLAAILCQQAGEARADDRMAAIVAEVRAQEAKYRDIEYALKTTTRKPDPSAPDRATDLMSIETCQVVLQGDRIFFRKDAHRRLRATRSSREKISAYDGERTRTVYAGNCVNIHLGRFEHPDVYPAHTFTLAHYRVNFPLSAYLAGTEAIHADPKYPHFARESGTVYEFTRVETHFEREEVVDGLRCAKIRIDRRSYSKDHPQLQYVWLAVERNFFPVKEELRWPHSDFGDMALHEMHVDRMREIAPGLWFPVKWTVTDYNLDALRQARKHVVAWRVETIIEKIDLSPRHDAAFFRDVAIPADLPVFTIKDRALVGSSLPEPAGGDGEKAKLAEIVARVAEQEKRYHDMEVKAHVNYRHLGMDIVEEGVVTEQTKEEHSAFRAPLAYFRSRQRSDTLGGQRVEEGWVEAFDGEWTRKLYQQMDAEPGNTNAWALLRKGGLARAGERAEGVAVHRPHMLMMHDDRISVPLADLLAAPWEDRGRKSRLRFRHCGERVVDGHPCVVLRGDSLSGPADRVRNSWVLFLATDRNLIPIRWELYGGNFGLGGMPSSIGWCEDFREVAPGTWYPFHVVVLAFDTWIPTAQGRLSLNWRREYHIDSVAMSPAVDRSLFHEVVAPAGAQVQVQDEAGEFVGQFPQEQDGVPEVTPARYLEMSNEARARKEQARKQRVK